MEIIHLNRSEFERVLPLVWDVFLTYEAANYPENGKKSFYDAIHSKEYLDMLDMYAAFDGTQIVGVIATRENKTHIALFFVNGHYHRKGIGRQLFQACMNENTSDKITVHSSLYAADVYRKLGFTDTGSCTIENGMQYIPMEWTRR